jgi:NADH-quinone oxidoreductase subunit E
VLSPEHLAKIEELKKLYPTTKALTLPVLWMVQQERGWISPESMKEVAELIDMPVSHVYGVVTFYTMFNTKPVGRHHIQVCTNISCYLLGGDELRDHICQKLNVKLGQLTPDERFTVHEVECLGSCGSAPMMQVNDDYHENLTLGKVDKLLEELK